jgi:hypothetical protein
MRFLQTGRCEGVGVGREGLEGGGGWMGKGGRGGGVERRWRGRGFTLVNGMGGAPAS